MVLSGIMAGVGAVASLAGGIIGAVKSAEANRKANALIQQQRDENKRWYETQMATDYTQRSDAQAILKKQRELLNEQYKSAAARNIVAGGTSESLALQQEQANQSMDNTMTNLAAQASAHKDSVEQQYRQTDAQINQQQVGVYQNQGNQISKAAGQLVSSGLGMVSQGITSMDGKTGNGVNPDEFLKQHGQLQMPKLNK